MLNKNTLSAIGAALIALGQELCHPEGSGDTAPTETPTGATRRGRAPKTETQAEEKPAGTKTESELRELVRPLVEGGRAEEVKKLLAKHGGTKCGDLPAANHAAFTRDLEALTI